VVTQTDTNATDGSGVFYAVRAEILQARPVSELLKFSERWNVKISEGKIQTIYFSGRVKSP
jgi:hypothetical protein